MRFLPAFLLVNQYFPQMALHPKRSGHSKRHRETLGHIRMNVDQLDNLIESWSLLCESITISVGDGITADFVEDLNEISSEELANLVIRTEEPNTAISLRDSRAELSYSDDPRDESAVTSVRQSLQAFRIRPPFYRLRIFWAWIYSFVITLAVFIDFGIQGSRRPPFPRVSTAYLLPPPPPPPPFLAVIPIVTLVTFISLAVWFIYSYKKLASQSSTRIIRKRSRH